jgi:hypothetical protein
MARRNVQEVRSKLQLTTNDEIVTRLAECVTETGLLGVTAELLLFLTYHKVRAAVTHIRSSTPN